MLNKTTGLFLATAMATGILASSTAAQEGENKDITLSYPDDAGRIELRIEPGGKGLSKGRVRYHRKMRARDHGGHDDAVSHNPRGGSPGGTAREDLASRMSS